MAKKHRPTGLDDRMRDHFTGLRETLAAGIRLAIVDYGLAAETLELGADEHIEKVREFLGDDKYDAITIPEAT